MGLDGKTLIHPSQIDICNEVFAPTAAEVESARAIIDAFALPENQGKGVIQLNGKMVELLHAEMASRTLAIADGDRGPEPDGRLNRSARRPRTDSRSQQELRHGRANIIPCFNSARTRRPYRKLTERGRADREGARPRLPGRRAVGADAPRRSRR